MEPRYGTLEETFSDFKTPDQIEQEIIDYVSNLYDLPDGPVELAIEVLAMFRRGLSKNGYVFYQP